MARVRFDGATRHYQGTPDPAVRELVLDVEDGELMVFVGPSGCGKSTALRLVAGLEPVDAGEVWIGDDMVNNMLPKHRDVAMVFQSYALYPHMTVADNLAYALKVAKLGKTEIAERVRDAADMLELTPLMDRKPRHLSGGERQRVAMGRAVVRRPRVFLMDEPLSNLDARLRLQTRIEIVALQRRLEVTTVYVTHDQIEAMTMGDRVAVLKDGELQQVDTPRGLYDKPANMFVASFMGSPSMNLIHCDVVDTAAVAGPLSVPLTPKVRAQLGENGSAQAVVGVRPEAVNLVGEGQGIPVTVGVTEQLGSDAFAYCDVDDANAIQFVVKVDPRNPPERGERLWVKLLDTETHIFNPLTGLRVD